MTHLNKRTRVYLFLKPMTLAYPCKLCYLRKLFQNINKMLYTIRMELTTKAKLKEYHDLKK